MAQPRQRLAAGAHPLLALRHGVHAAAGHPDVLPRRPAVRHDPIFSSVPDEAPAAAGRRYDHDADRARMGPRLPLGHRARRPARHAVRARHAPTLSHAGPTPSQTVGPFLHHALPCADGPTSCRTARPARCVTVHGPVLDGDGSPCPTRWWRPGRPTPTAGSPRTTRAPSGATGSAASGAVPHRRRGPVRRSLPSARPGAPHPTAARRRTSSVSVFARGLLAPPVHPDLLRRRARQRRRPVLPCRRRAGARPWSPPRRTAGTASTSGCRARRSRSSSMS